MVDESNIARFSRPCPRLAGECQSTPASPSKRRRPQWAGLHNRGSYSYPAFHARICPGHPYLHVSPLAVKAPRTSSGRLRVCVKRSAEGSNPNPFGSTCFRDRAAATQRFTLRLHTALFSGGAVRR